MTIGREALRVLIVDDEPLTADAHATYVRRVDGFQVVGVAGTGARALQILDEQALAGSPVDLVILDMILTDLHGLDVARRIRRRGYTVDIIAVTAVRDLRVVRAALAAGVTQYLLKPFTFSAFREKLENHRGFRARLTQAGPLATQNSIDSALGSLRTPVHDALPKGLHADTLAQVTRQLRRSDAAQSAADVAAALLISPVTARRYLRYLAEQGQVTRAARHGVPGRPEHEYRWSGSNATG